MFKVNYSGVVESGNFEPLPAGDYSVVIGRVETVKTLKGDPMVKVRYNVINGEYDGRVLFDNVVIFGGNKPGAGMTKHFLHVIEEQYDGEFEIVPSNWVGKKLNVVLKVDEKYNNNKVTERKEYMPF